MNRLWPDRGSQAAGSSDFELASSRAKNRGRSRMKLCALRLVATIFCLLLAAQVAAAADPFPGAAWERVDPEAAGWSASKLAKAEQWSQRIGSIAVMVVHRGAVVAEWGDTSARTPLASVRKSLLSALIGIAAEWGGLLQS